MALHSFCGILTLQVGVAIISIVFWVIAILTFVVNFFQFLEPDSDDFPVYAFSITTFVILLIFAGLIAFFSAYNESNTLCMAGVGLICLITVIWVILSSLSFYNDEALMKFICIHDRCPETFWLAPLQYRMTKNDEPPAPMVDDYTTILTVETSSSPPNEKKRSIDMYLTRRKHQNLEFNDAAYFLNDENDIDDVPTNVVTTGGYEFGLPLIGAVVLFICNFLFFLFSILVLWSYGQELAWTDNYLRDITEDQ